MRVRSAVMSSLALLPMLAAACYSTYGCDSDPRPFDLDELADARAER